MLMIAMVVAATASDGSAAALNDGEFVLFIFIFVFF